MGGGNVLLKLPIITDCLGVMSLRTGCLVIAGFMMVIAFFAAYPPMLTEHNCKTELWIQKFLDFFLSLATDGICVIVIIASIVFIVGIINNITETATVMIWVIMITLVYLIFFTMVYIILYAASECRIQPGFSIIVTLLFTTKLLFFIVVVKSYKLQMEESESAQAQETQK